MDWSAISFYIRTPLAVISGTLNAQRYVDDILQPGLFPFIQCHSELTFQQDNARPHKESFAMYIRQAFRKLPWQTRPPAPSTTELIWKVIGR